MSICQTLSIEQIGDLINKAYYSYIKHNWANLKDYIQGIPEKDPIYPEMDLEPVYLYLSIDKESLMIEYEDICSSDYFQGVSPSNKWLIAIMVNETTTYYELMDINASEESYFYEDFEDYVKLTDLENNTFFLQISQISRINFTNYHVFLEYSSLGLFSKKYQVAITHNCFLSLLELLPLFSSLITF